MKKFNNFVTVFIFLIPIYFWGQEPPKFDKSLPASNLVQVYEVNKKVSDFLDKEDFSTPESAYVVINRSAMATGDESAWKRISCKETRDRMSSDAKKRDVKPEDAQVYLNAKILEVRIFQGKFARVHAELIYPDGKKYIDGRSVVLEDGKWLNRGQDLFDNMEQAREKFARICSILYNKDLKPKRGKIDDPESYLQPFIKFLKTKGEEPKPFVINAIAKYPIVIMGEIHHRPLYWAFNSLLVTDSNFPKSVGTIYMELPSNDQSLVDKFLEASSLDPKPVIEMLRDIFEMGWPDQPMLDFFLTVWMVNQNLPKEQKIRIVLVDMKRPWKEIIERGDWKKYDVDRDKLMAENIISYIKEHPQEKRHSLFIVGVGHSMLNFKYAEGTSVKKAGWYLGEKLGRENIYSIFPHMPVQTNMGQVSGRLCLGLFDSAFTELGNKPVAFDIFTGPFGSQPFDAMPDDPVFGTYKDGYNAYLYLGPLEYEIFSPIIAGFYTDEFVKEMDRRNMLMYGKSWSDIYHKELNIENAIKWMSGSWGKPRDWRYLLGPINAWHSGDDWKANVQLEKYKDALANPEIITNVTKQLFEVIKNADYNRNWVGDGSWEHFLPDTLDYCVRTDFPSWVEWICKTFKENPINSYELGKVFKDEKERPAIPYKIILKDNSTIEGILPFEYIPQRDVWMGMMGLDWHLKSAIKKENK